MPGATRRSIDLQGEQRQGRTVQADDIYSAALDEVIDIELDPVGPGGIDQEPCHRRGLGVFQRIEILHEARTIPHHLESGLERTEGIAQFRLGGWREIAIEPFPVARWREESLQQAD